MELSYISGLLRRSLCAILLCLQAQGLYLVCDLWYLTFDVIYDATIKIFLILIFQRLLYLFSRKQYPTVFQNCGRFPYSSLMPRCLYLFMKRQLYFACAWLWYLSFQNVFLIPLTFLYFRSRVPWGGFAQLTGSSGSSLFTICLSTEDHTRLPTASTWWVVLYQLSMVVHLRFTSSQRLMFSLISQGEYVDIYIFILFNWLLQIT